MRGVPAGTCGSPVAARPANSMPVRRLWIAAYLAVTFVAMGRREVHAQSERSSWELEVHAGGLLNARHGGGSGSLPLTGAMVGGQMSVTSFFFGDGARMVNENQAGVLGNQAARVTPLDPVLLGSAIQWGRVTGAVGIRASRPVWRRMAVEISVEHERVALAFTERARAGIEEARASVTQSLAQALATSSVPATVTTLATTDGGQRGSQVSASGTIVVHAKDRQRFTPYGTVGAGVVFNRIDTPSATLTARYELGATGEVVGTETVTLRYTVNDFEYMGIVGGGVKYRLARRWGMRVDGRARLLLNQVVNRVDSASSVARRSTGSPFPLVNVGALQFSSTAPLTGAPIVDAPTFASGRVRAQATMSVGLFWRF